MNEEQVQQQIEAADAVVKAADTAIIFALKQQHKFFVALVVVSIVFALTVLGIVGIHAWQESQIYTEIQYEDVGSMGDSNTVNTGEGTIQSASTITNNSN